ncbi:unnamed protein product [Boreogadus saida]
MNRQVNRFGDYHANHTALLNLCPTTFTTIRVGGPSTSPHHLTTYEACLGVFPRPPALMLLQPSHSITSLTARALFT